MWKPYLLTWNEAATNFNKVSEKKYRKFPTDFKKKSKSVYEFERKNEHMFKKIWYNFEELTSRKQNFSSELCWRLKTKTLGWWFLWYLS